MSYEKSDTSYYLRYEDSAQGYDVVAPRTVIDELNDERIMEIVSDLQPRLSAIEKFLKQAHPRLTFSLNIKLMPLVNGGTDTEAA